jgi:hypothetical protein
VRREFGQQLDFRRWADPTPSWCWLNCLTSEAAFEAWRYSQAVCQNFEENSQVVGFVEVRMRFAEDAADGCIHFDILESPVAQPAGLQAPGRVVIEQAPCCATMYPVLCLLKLFV